MIAVERKLAIMSVVLVLVRTGQVMVCQEAEKGLVLVLLCMFNEMLDKPRELYQLVQFSDRADVGTQYKYDEPAEHPLQRYVCSFGNILVITKYSLQGGVPVHQPPSDPLGSLSICNARVSFEDQLYAGSFDES